jgi:DNA-binding LacI/PurR family transcriptional regulator
MSLVVFITHRTAELFTPPLTAIDFPAYQFGYQAARMLIDRLNGSTIVEHNVPQPQLIVRRSTAPPRPAAAAAAAAAGRSA